MSNTAAAPNKRRSAAASRRRAVSADTPAAAARLATLCGERLTATWLTVPAAAAPLAASSAAKNCSAPCCSMSTVSALVTHPAHARQSFSVTFTAVLSPIADAWVHTKDDDGQISLHINSRPTRRSALPIHQIQTPMIKP